MPKRSKRKTKSDPREGEERFPYASAYQMAIGKLIAERRSGRLPLSVIGTRRRAGDRSIDMLLICHLDV